MTRLNSFGARTTLQTPNGAVEVRSACPPSSGPASRRSPACPTRCASCSRTSCAWRTAPSSRRTTSRRSPAGTRPGTREREIAFSPARVLLQDFTGVPAVVDLAAMRDGVAALGGDPQHVNPLQPVDLVIDHSVQVDYFGQSDAFELNGELEYQRNRERYVFLRWGQSAFSNFRVVPPETGIVHQVNLEYLARVVCRETRDGVCRRSRTRWSAPTRTRRWSTASASRLGRRRHRSRGGDARPADLDADPRGRRLPAEGPAARGRDRDRPRADRHPAAAQAGRRRQVRRVLRPGIERR